MKDVYCTQRRFIIQTHIPAAEPCLSPLASFLNAYEIVIGRLHKYCPFIASIAASEASKLAKLMNAKPLELPVSGSRIICKECTCENSHTVSNQRQCGWNQRKQNTKKVFSITYFRGLENDTKSTKCVVEQLFINLWIKISDENVCTNIKILIMRRCLR